MQSRSIVGSSMLTPMHTLIEALSLAGLVAATLEYALLLRRREGQRARWREGELAADTGLQGLVRVFLADEGRQPRTYSPE